MAVAVSVLPCALAGPALADNTTTTPTTQTPTDALPFIANPATGQNDSIVQESTNAVLTDTGYQILQVAKIGDTFVPLGAADTYTVTAVTTAKDANGNDVVTSVEARDNTTSAVSSFDIAEQIIPTTVINPDTGDTETVLKVASLSMVLTSFVTTAGVTEHHMILLPTTKNAKVYVPSTTPGVPTVYTVDDIVTDTSTGLVTGLKLAGITDPVARVNDGTDAYKNLPDPQNGSGTPGVTTPTITVPPGDVAIVQRGTGNPGDNGKDGGGFEICFGIFGCIDIAYHPTSGDPGQPGPNYHLTVTQALVQSLYPGETSLHTATSGTAPTPAVPPSPGNPSGTPADPGNPGAPGILLVGVGGTGGEGGDAYGNIQAAPGGTAGVGGNIWLTNDVDIATTGISSHGIYVKSSAGQGGEGGSGYIFSGGGFGGSAAQAGTVEVYNFGTIRTGGDYAIGIQAQSLGGRAGDGGDSYGFVGNGGGGSSGGNGSTVIVENHKEIDTVGAFAHGILAQSIGGSGGNGGESGGLVSYGDSGGAGGDGGDVTVTNFGIITTYGSSARGIFAESIGGGGGTGGDSIGLAAVGGGGGPGSFGGVVTVTNTGSINTYGNKSIAIFAQSVGGGGGDGGSSSGAFFSVGGGGSSGGDGGNASVINSGHIATTGADAHGIQVQSVGGGGGNGGASQSTSAFYGIAVGGNGGDGGVGGTVGVTFGNSTQPGDIETQGDRARGIFAQSVGGGGGAGGAAMQISAGFGAAVSLAIGGSGGKGGIGGTVDIGDVQHCQVASTCYAANQDDLFIRTQGDNAEGLYAQSVGGGGGAGGYALSSAVSISPAASVSMSTAIGGSGATGGGGGNVTVRTGGAIQTGDIGGAYVMQDGLQTTIVRNRGEFSTGLLAQSVGGGGGKGGYSISAAVAGGAAGGLTLGTGIGGDAAGGGDGGTVDADFNGSITTYGDDASGAIIQSVGGGGGTGGYNISASIAVGGVAGLAASVGVGGSGGKGGAGGEALGTIGGDVFTYGARSTGVVVQSVGGGGGDGGYNISGSIGAGGAGGAGIAVGVGGSGQTGGGGGHVEGTTLGQLLTTGDEAGGLLVQSVGGGGGNGGFDISGSIGAGGVAGGGISVGVGGSGAHGGDGGYVMGDAVGGVTTAGKSATGVTVQSLGGGGGNGGFAVAGSIGAGGTVGGGISVGVGGSGGVGATGGEVHGFAGSITTSGDNSGGFLAQSVGGGGGNGGFAVAGSIGAGGTVGGGISVSLGGSGAGGGDGGTVEGRVSDWVTTSGMGSTGVTVQSLGGGGGNGGFSIAGSIGAGGTGGGGVSVGLGGSGGGAGNGEAVDASAMSITTYNDFSGGFLAQSVGGGGGNGGFSVAGSIGAGGTGGGAISVGIGGSGGGGGAGGRVGATVAGNVLTQGAQSDAIVAQSLGGGGGNGGFTIAGGIGIGGTGGGAVSVGIGGSGAGGGNSGTVDLTVTGLTETVGANSNGIIAQSIGGGGGNGGFSVAGNIAAGGTGAGSVGVAIGGSGGDGGDAGSLTDKVTLNVTGLADPTSGERVAVATTGAGSRAILAQSVGGGGGNGGFSIAGSVSLAKTGAGNIGVGIGGSGGNGGIARDVEGNVTGDVLTLGDSDAQAVLVQSIGGGGGNGGFNITGGLAASTKGAGNLLVGVGGMGGDGGASGEVTGTVIGNITTFGTNSAGVTYQSLAGGGGNGGFNITGGVSLTSSSSGASGNIGVGVGGFGGNGSDAKLVDATVLGNITTLGNQSYGALLQSVGGGGGNGGFNITGSFEASGSKGGSIGFGLGGFGGDGGAAGTVTGILSGDVRTYGDGAYGVMLQSLGGGGGNGGFNVTAGAALTSGDNAALGVGIGGFGGAGGHSDNVDGTVTGTYATYGVNSGGVIVQSLGGGGGNGGLNITGELNLSAKGKSAQASVGVGGFGGDGGYAGTATLLRTGDTYTSGADSQAILVQSVGGGGGNGGVNVSGGLVASKGDDTTINIGLGGFGGKASYADAVDATIIGNVYATGLGANTSGSSLFTGAVVAQSVGGGGGAGGLNVTGGVSLTKSGSSGKAASIGIGGFAGGGGDAGTIDLALHAPSVDRVAVVASGDNRAAVVAQSLGGGGGVGGINVAGGISSNSALAFGIGGFGGDGGMGKAVTANIDADIGTSGDGTRGILAQSLGGGGGAGGINVSGTVNINAQDDKSITFGLGGFGGAGNISGVVKVTQNGVIIVDGASGIGLLAQSVAGGGGDGGLNVSANIIKGSANKNAKRIVAGIGGTAGDGADAGDVTVNSTGDIAVNGPASTATADNPSDTETTVFNSGGILAQSIGGGGGTGGMNISATAARNAGDTLQFAMGGDGGAGGNAGNVTVIRGYDAVTQVADASVIETVGDYSSGLVAQSVGGGGGNGGMNFNYANNDEPKAEEDDDSNKKYAAAQISIGGDGADAGNGKIVTVRHNGDIYTDGVYSHGIVAQSIGGGGGSSNVNIGLGQLGDKTAGINIGVGGANGAAGIGALVDVDHVGTISTAADGSIGIKAQSIGGGGGSTNGFNQYLDPILDAITGHLDSSTMAVNIGREGGTGGEGGEVRVRSDGSIFTGGTDAFGIMAQSVGGGGGSSGTTTVGGDFSFESASYGGNLAVGLDGGKAAFGGIVTVTTFGDIETQGDRSAAIFAQSLGGGGGMGGTVGDKLALNTTDKENTTSADINIGGKGGDGSYAQQVTVDNSADLLTFGDHADGIWAQSIGGSGGNGGDFLSATIKNISSDKTARSFSLNVGGTGGTGAIGGGVTVTNKSFIETAGIQSFGVRAESIGGGGGDGGAVTQVTLQTGGGSNQSVDINVGGDGGDGGKGGIVHVTNEGAILTEAFGAEGIRATSTGGGGGNAGVIIDTLLSATGQSAQTQAISMNIGGKGGTGGEGGAVTVENTPTADDFTGIIWTQGDSAHGIFAQSLGGGGGNGSSIISMNGLSSTKDSIVAGLNFGGEGGKGNIAGAVNVDNSGVIETDGDNAYGILAQSTGGGGGNGGLVLAAAATFGGESNTKILSIGGNGGDGGNGGAVTVNNTGSIFTAGDGSHGIVAQSIGGGGGNAGIGVTATDDAASFAISNTLSLIAGATGGGEGGIGGNVMVTQAGDVSVLGEGAQAVVAESINGGGGHLDFDLTGVTGMPGFSFKSAFADAFGIKPADIVTDPKIDTRLGGVDLSDMNAGKVTVITTGTFGVGGDNGVGSFTQSLGGGGGTLHLKTVQAAANSLGAGFAPTAISYAVTLGGQNGTNNSGADLDGQRTGYILTTGVDSLGVLSQSIGGGGGHAIIDITTESGALVGPINLSFGSSNGSNEAGGNILRTEDGAVTTLADLSSAILVQSIGGGGGAASIILHADPSILAAVSAPAPANASDPSDQSMIRPLSSAPPPAPVSLSFGAAGGSGLNAGNVTNTYAGAGTVGDHALGLFIQSVGAGGGEATVSGNSAANVTLGGTLSASGNGGALTIGNTDDVETEGAGSHGVFLQSIGGGGGAVFGAGPGSTVTLNTANTGNGGALQLTQDGSVQVTGAAADGVIAQSLGGGGGWIDGLFAGTAGGTGKGGAITLNLNSGVAATGSGATGVFAQSLGSLDGGNITVNAADMIRGNAAGLSLDGGATNIVTTEGSVSAVSGLAISATGGNDAVLNDGMVIGNIDLGTGANSFTNRTGSTFIAYNTIDLYDPPSPATLPAAPAATFSNSGDFQMGLSAPRTPIDLGHGAVFDNLDADGDPETNLLYGARVINTVALDGNFVQTAAGHMAFDAAFGPYASDRVNVTGTAQVAGTGTVTLTWLGNSDPLTLFAAAGGGVDNGLKIDDTLAMDYSISAGAKGIQLIYIPHFDQPYLNRNGQSLGRHMNSALGLGGSDGIGRTMALLGNLRAGEENVYSHLFDELSPEPFVTPLIAQNEAAERFNEDMLSCVAAIGPVDRTCAWGHLDSHSLNRIADFESYAATSQGQSLSTGFERPLNDLWSVTVAVGYDRINSLVAGNNRARSDGQSLDLGVGLRRMFENGGDMAMSLSSGWQSLDTKRQVDVFEPLVGSSSPQSTYLRASFKMGYTHSWGHIYARPMLNMSATTLHQEAFQEDGLEGIGIAGQAHTQFIAEAGPEFAIGYASSPGAPFTTRFEVNLGRVYRDVRYVNMTYRLIGANPDSVPALIGTFVGRTDDHVGFSLNMAKPGGRMSMRFSYNSDQSAKLHNNALDATLKMKF